MAKKKRQTIRWSKKRIRQVAELVGFLLLLTVSVISLVSSGELWNILGLPEQENPDPMPTGELQVYYLDVGQGDSALLRIPAGEETYTVLVDAGDNGKEEQLLQELSSLGVTTIDAAVWTHPHTDHIGGAAEVLRAIDVENVYMPPVPENMTPTSATYEAMLDAMLERGLRYTEATAGMVLYEGEGVSLTVVSPQPGDDWDDLNDWSVVLRLVYGDTAFLFTGDAEAVCEQKILDSGWDVSCNVLKMGHHGSSTSSSPAFLDACAPQYAVISCGEDNSYGHPHRETLAALEERDITYFRTDTSGTILATSDGTTVALRPAA